ncbi:hypothetical protein PISL3812_00758 [Talaromyces islandicus]|uniref:Phospholipid/glycerol acyltransferase domain-containing protein n=1 Tax=Talaromyces islandicus TaxID=28573 RepID=A0A0U1LK65_TALIS|nr:hypothetical protein PISL3812_00758 [Talaromyces islandicus]
MMFKPAVLLTALAVLAAALPADVKRDSGSTLVKYSTDQNIEEPGTLTGEVDHDFKETIPVWDLGAKRDEESGEVGDLAKRKETDTEGVDGLAKRTEEAGDVGDLAKRKEESGDVASATSQDDSGSGIAPFFPVPTQPSGYVLPLHVFLFCFRLPLLIFVCLSYFLVLQFLPIGSLGKKASLWCILGVPSLWWIDLQVDGVKRGHLASQRSRLPSGNSIIASSFTSPIDAVYLAAIFDPIFTASYPDTRKVEQLSLLGAILRSFEAPEAAPPAGTRLVELSELLEKYPSRPIAVFAECTTTNGRGILPLSRSLVSAPPRTKIYPISLRYTEPDVTTPVPGCYIAFLWNLLSRPTHFIRVRVAEHVSTSSKSPSEGRSTANNFFDDEEEYSSSNLLDTSPSTTSELTKEDKALLDHVGESLARLGRVKRVGLGVKEKADFVRAWNRHRRR